jgi:dienelactone hydrolase
VIRSLFALVLVVLTWIPAVAQPLGPYTPEGLRLREQFWLVPSGDPATPVLRAIVLRPPGESPRPLAVVAHPTLDNAPIRAGFPMAPSLPLARLLVERGHVVIIPVRRGYGATGGVYRESLGDCENADFAGPAWAGARDLAATLAFFRTRPFVAPTGLIIAGQAGGALAALALAAEQPEGLAGVILFSAGRGARQEGREMTQCRADGLVSTVADLAGMVRAPILMLAAENDRLYPPAMAERLRAAMAASGAPVRLRVLPPVGTDGHDLLGTLEGPAAWLPAVAGFLTEIAK